VAKPTTSCTGRQFHFTPRKNWTNNPNRLVFYKGEHHLFCQLNAKGIRRGPNTWAHAVDELKEALISQGASVRSPEGI